MEFLDEDASRMKVDMGYAAFGADSIHAVGFEGDMINESVFFCDNFYNITCVSMGNPNCVVMMEEISKNKALHLGPYVENSKYFPNRINMQLCHVVDREIFRLKSMSGEPGTHMRQAREPVRRHLQHINSDWWETVCRFICRAEICLWNLQRTTACL